MTEFFVEMFKNRNKCTLCKKDAGTKSLCPEHLKKARDSFRVWSSKRRSEGLCLHCDKKGFKKRGFARECRCYEHKLLNQARCKAWGSMNRERSQEYAKRKRAKFAALGVCRCAAHSPVAPGRRKCQACLDRHKKYNGRRR